jgi:alpha,alpha-trehalose phosphorylase
VWSALVFGFGGVRDFDGRLSFDPALPRSWEEHTFSLRFGGRQLRVRLTHEQEQYLIEEGNPLEVTVRGKPYLLNAGTALTCSASRHEPTTSGS